MLKKESLSIITCLLKDFAVGNFLFDHRKGLTREIVQRALRARAEKVMERALTDPAKRHTST